MDICIHNMIYELQKNFLFSFFIYFGWLWRKRSLDILETKFTLI
ncbi:MAG: hypothetical protein NT01SARS_1203 [SAR86 cluster bacterium SAR86A]|uniref:Uncharacterized protein n=1 Tax=SAR86 cluster bacterium SAR86A TaxID=1123866 RepID=J5KBR7_9GAMM|nr:MAG: hypothetical protein NT01SARS_1203 [SAR86 cluster bacterium SAR86A]